MKVFYEEKRGFGRNGNTSASSVCSSSEQRSMDSRTVQLLLATGNEQTVTDQTCSLAKVANEGKPLKGNPSLLL